MTSRACARCGEPVPPGRTSYCGEACRLAAKIESKRAKRAAARPSMTVICAWCGAPFDPWPQVQRTSCGAPCRIELERQRWRKKAAAERRVRAPLPSSPSAPPKPVGPVETVEEYLARGGKIKKYANGTWPDAARPELMRFKTSAMRMAGRGVGA